MNLTYPCFRSMALVCCVFSFVQLALAQSGPSIPIPDEYRYLLNSSTGERTATASDYLIHYPKTRISDSFKILRKLKAHWMIVRFSEWKDGDLSTHELFPVNDLWKLSDPDLIDRQDFGPVTIKLANMEGLDLLDLDAMISSQAPYVKAMVDKNQLNQLMANEDVLYIGLESIEAQVDGAVLDLNLNPNKISKVHSVYPDLRGNDLTVGVKEDRFDLDDPDLTGRGVISEWASDEQNFHATDMATIIGGAGLTFGNSRGVADRVQLVSTGFGELMPDPNAFYQSQDLKVQNHSYGGEVESFYGASAEAYDQLANDLPQLLHVMSSGNRGQETPGSGSYQGLEQWANLTGNYKNAKNNLVVGAVDTTDVLMPFSSVGPAGDGRIKPEVVAYSTSGTSSAAALVSGVAILLQEAFQDSFTDDAPSDLIKALLINGARDVGEKGPDFKTGFGNVDAWTSLQTLQNEQFFNETVEKDNSKLLSFSVPEGAINLKVTLVWNDPAGQANDLQPLVNNLDLVLTDPDGKEWLPWVLDHSADLSALEAEAIRGNDDLNNAEQVTLDLPKEGDYQVAVSGAELFTDAQEFSLVYDFQLSDAFAWDYPLEGNFMPYNGESGSYFRWTSTFQENVGMLSISLDNGDSWQLLDDQVDLTKGHLRWHPVDLNSLARVKMDVGDVSFVSDPFVVTSTLRVSSGFDCTDSLMIRWPLASNTSAYEILKLEDQRLTLVKTVEDTFAILSGEELRTGWLRVIPKLGEYEAIGSPLFSPVDFGSNCYISSFFGLKNDDGVALSADLTSYYQVSSAHFEHQTTDGFGAIHSIDDFSSTLLEYLDVTPIEGNNSYRLRLELDNGVPLISDTLNIIYLNQKVALIYPNPVKSGEEILFRTNGSSDETSMLKVYDFKGNLLLEEEITDLTSLRTDRMLIPGIYLYTVENSKGKAYGKFVVF